MIFGSKVYRAERVQNTLEWAKENIASAQDGSVFLANHVESAQGRQGRIWQIAQGQLLLTAILKPESLSMIESDDLEIRLNQLTMAMCLGILDPLKKYGTKLKWPNDFVINDKKVCGMLMQTIWEKNKVQGIILGFGLNINNSFYEENELFQTATSLKSVLNQELSMREIYKELLTSLDTFYEIWKEKKFIDIYKQWKQEQIFLHKKIKIHLKDGSLIDGTLSQVLPNGDAMITTSDAQIKIVQPCIIEKITK